MKLIIDVPENIYEALRKADVIISGQRSGKSLTSIIFDAVAKGTPLEQYEFRQKMFSYLDGVADGLKEANRDTIVVLDKIKAEIEEYKSRQLTLAIGVDDLEKGKQIAIEYAFAIIDKYKAERSEE